MTSDPSTGTAVSLRRRLGLPLLVLYGTGITVGAGIYVLIGEVAGYAGVYDFLKAEGCDELQGYLFSRPLPSDAFELYLRSGVRDEPPAAVKPSRLVG